MNNILHLRYALEIERTGSISKAAANLYMGQPQLSKAIRELEDSLGSTIFNRTSKGVTATEKGKVFLGYARNILAQIDEMEALYKPADGKKQKFDISVPRASYISYAFTEFIKELDMKLDVSLNYRETNSVRAIKNVSDNINNLAIVRYQSIYEDYFLRSLEERNLRFKEIWEFEYLALMSEKHPLAKEKTLDFHSLAEFTEIIHGDISVPSLPISEAKLLNVVNSERKTISIYERGSQFELLSRIPTTYIWVSPMPEDVLNCFNLVQKKCSMAKNKYKDILIYRKGYKFSKYDEMFVKKLNEAVSYVSEYLEKIK